MTRVLCFTVASLRFLFRSVSVAEERDFERANVARKADRYLRTNPLDRVRSDPAYSSKIEHIRAGLQANGSPIKGPILDIGGNTAGEATILQQEGFSFVVGDINEGALQVSRKRVRKFQLEAPAYVALDVQELPFSDCSFSAVTVIEALHHFPDYQEALAEVYRVLKPGGVFYSHEPNGFNPLRRLSEVRDRFRGTIEKSFFIGQMERLLRNARFEQIQVRAVPMGFSNWKMEEVPRYRRPIKRLHGVLQRKIPYFFGPLDIHARKPGILADTSLEANGWKQFLRSPISHSFLTYDSTKRRWMESSGGHSFPDLDGIPVLIHSDGTAAAQEKT